MQINMLLTVYVKPSARENKILEWLDEDTLKVSVTAPPQKGKANKAVIKLLADELNLAKSDIEIVRGHTTRMKHISIPTKS